MKDINRKRLEWMATANPKPGNVFPVELLSEHRRDDWDGWTHAAPEAIKEALDELASYRGIKVDIANEIVHIDGIKYARSLFEGFAWETPLNQLIRIVKRESGTLQIERVPTWQPIETAPIEPWTPQTASYYRFRCLLQLSPQWVQEGEGYWVTPRPNSKIKTPTLRWRTHLGVCAPTHWQPLPMPFNKPLNEEAKS